MRPTASAPPLCPMKAVEYYSKAGNVGHAMACLSAGQMYEDGRKIAQNYSDAAKWYRKAADLGHAQARVEYNRIEGE